MYLKIQAKGKILTDRQEIYFNLTNLMCNGKTLALIFNIVKDFALVHALNISLQVKHFHSASGVHVVNFSSQVISFGLITC